MMRPQKKLKERRIIREMSAAETKGQLREVASFRMTSCQGSQDTRLNSSEQSALNQPEKRRLLPFTVRMISYNCEFMTEVLEK
jgi:hypothetical protein